jgi:hypothetical protein
MSLLTRKGKRWPELSKNPQRFSSASPFQHQSNIETREPELAMDLFSVTGIDKKGRTISQTMLTRNEFGIGHLPSDENEYHHIRHNRRKTGRRHAFVENQQSTFEAEKDDDLGVLNNNLHDRDNTPLHHPVEGDEKDSRNEIIDEAMPTVITSNRSPNLPRRCQGSEKSKDSNCTSERNHFPSSVLMIEAHYNQTVRDFLQICTPVERVEIENVDDVQMLLNALYEQMTVKDMSKAASSIVLLFNLEHYANWTNERVIEVLQSSVNALHNGFKDMMIYSKFHQDGADSNDTHLTLTYDVKYWLSELCNQRLTPCADFASIILESVLQINEIGNEGPSKNIASGEVDSLEDASSQANA